MGLNLCVHTVNNFIFDRCWYVCYGIYERLSVVSDSILSVPTCDSLIVFSFYVGLAE